jgi:hypothetical protein
VDIKGDYREIEFDQSNRGPDKSILPKRQKEVVTTRFGDNAILVTTTEPLPAGQYIIGINQMQMYDFGVQ